MTSTDILRGLCRCCGIKDLAFAAGAFCRRCQRRHAMKESHTLVEETKWMAKKFPFEWRELVELRAQCFCGASDRAPLDLWDALITLERRKHGDVE